MRTPTATPHDVSALLAGRRRILVTGAAGYGLRPTDVNIGGAVVRRLLTDSDALVFKSLRKNWLRLRVFPLRADHAPIWLVFSESATQNARYQVFCPVGAP